MTMHSPSSNGDLIKKNQVTVAQFAYKKPLLNTPHSPQFKSSLPQQSENSKQNKLKDMFVMNSAKLTLILARHIEFMV